jgi:hypothetical protein
MSEGIQDVHRPQSAQVQEMSAVASPAEAPTGSPGPQRTATATATAEGRGEGGREPVRNATSTDSASEHKNASGLDARPPVEEAGVPGPGEGQNATTPPPEDISPRPAPLPHDASSETVSVTATSISNPTLEVDVDNSVSSLHFTWTGGGTRSNTR